MTDRPDTPDVPTEDVTGAGAPAGAPEVESAPAPAAPDDETNGVRHRLFHDVEPDEHAKVVAERDQYLDALQRLKAEFENYRKRVDRDREAQHLAGVRDLCGDLLPVVDNLERALEAALGHDGAEQIVAGVEMVRGQLAGLLGGRGVSEIEAHAEAFDPNVHEAIAQHPSDDHAEGTVVHVIEKGYRIGDTVIRPAKVVVAAPSGGPQTEGE